MPHGFFGRFPEDDGSEESLGHYRRTVSEALGVGGEPVMLRQVHSPVCVPVGEPWRYSERPEGDALVTNRPGTTLAIVTADCAPVLFADQQAGVIGAAHAGWRGALGGVLENTVAAMERLGAVRENIAAAIGPTIAQASYEVDDGFRQSFSEEADRFFSPGRIGHWQFDLPGYVSLKLKQAGIGKTDNLALNTYTNPALFHSYRRATHDGSTRAGRQISAVALP